MEPTQPRVINLVYNEIEGRWAADIPHMTFRCTAYANDPVQAVRNVLALRELHMIEKRRAQQA